MSKNNGWAPKVPLGELLKKNDRTTIIAADKTYREVTVKLWGRGLVERRTVLGSDIAAARRSVVRGGQFILSRIDARNGATGIVPEELDGAVVSNDFPTFDAVSERLLPAYLGWLSKTPQFVDACRRASEGTTNRVRLKEDVFLQQTIPLPPLETQLRIVATIERLTSQLDAARTLIAAVDTECDIFPTCLHADLSRKRLRKLDKLITLDEDQVAVEPNLDYPQIGIRGFGGGLFQKTATRGSETTYKHFNRIREGQLVLSQVKGWEGAIAVAGHKESGWFASPEYRTFTCIESECVPRYLDRIVRTTWFRSKLQMATRGQGARRERTRPEMLLDMEIPFPTVDQQLKAVRWLESFRAMRESHSHIVRSIEAVLPAILDRAYRGQL